MNTLSKIPEFSGEPLKQAPLKNTRPLRSLAKSAPAETGNEIWFLTLSDLLMLLLIFFVLLFGMALKQQSNTIVSTAPRKVEVSPVLAKEQPAAKPVSATSPAADDANALLESDLLNIIDDNSGLQGITVARHSGNIVLTLPEQITFDSGQAELKSSVLPKLEQIAVFIQKHPTLSVEIQGHTDDRPIASRRYPSNWELSADRATQVAKSMVRLGVSPEKISTRGFGEYHPLYLNDSESNRLKNRRVEIQFSPVSSS